MKYSLSIQILLIIMLIYGCEESTTTETEESVTQVLFFYAFHADSYWDSSTQEPVMEKNTSGGGVIIADPMPTFEYFKMGEETFSDEDYSHYLPGYIVFGDFSLNNNTLITSNFSPLNVEVKTSLGLVTGSVNLPDVIDLISLSEYDTLALGEPFTINWTGSNADFYNVNCYYRWINNEGNTESADLQEFVTGNSITYPGSEFMHNGEISFVYVQPVNGPLPIEGAEGNMTGDGNGFLYYNINGTGYDGENIVVGTGNNNFPKIAFEIEAKQQLDKNRKTLEKRIIEIQ